MGSHARRHRAHPLAVGDDENCAVCCETLNALFGRMSLDDG
jgi:hypothetical protein